MNRSLKRIFEAQRNVSDTLKLELYVLLVKFDLC